MSFLLPALLLFLFSSQVSANCRAKIIESSDINLVCVCNSTYCDELPEIGPLGLDEAVVIQSSRAGQRFEREKLKFGPAKKSSYNIRSKESLADGPSITIEPRLTYQEIYGFGGAFTDSAGINIASLSPDSQQKLLEAYFGKNGLQYSLGRVPMASCDFSTREYSYLETPNDFDLSDFKLTEEDFKFKLPYILKALNLTGGNMSLFASPWSAPGWMKNTGQMKGAGRLKNDTRIYKAYADYFVRFFEEYRKQGVPFWGATVQNEPTTGGMPQWGWQTMYFSAFTMSEFVAKYLGPALANSEVTNRIQLMGLDDGRVNLPAWADVIYDDPVAKNYVAGMGVHWYGDAYSPPFLLDMTHKSHPDKFILATEACAGFMQPQGPILGDWYRAELYADSILTNLNHWVTGWTDWNLVLDLEGGPNWVGNVVDAPIIVNKTADEFYKQPMFYAMGHFSKFLRPGAWRIGHKISVDIQNYLTVVATKKNAQRTLVILNRSENHYDKVSISEETNTQKALIVTIPPRSLTTIVWNKGSRRKFYAV